MRRAPRAPRSPASPSAPSPAPDVGSRFDAPEANPGFVLWQVATIWQRQVRAAVEPLGLTHAQFVLLASAAWLEARSGDEPVTQAVIAEHARTDAVMTSEVLRTLERRQLVKRLPHPADGRAKRITVTPAGRALVKRAIAAVESVDVKFFGAPGPELRALATLLRPIASSEDAR